MNVNMDFPRFMYVSTVFRELLTFLPVSLQSRQVRESQDQIYAKLK